MDSPIKETGSYDVVVKIHPEVKASIKVEVVNEEEGTEAPQESAAASETETVASEAKTDQDELQQEQENQEQ